jgi:hypothetical protein
LPGLLLEGEADFPGVCLLIVSVLALQMSAGRTGGQGDDHPKFGMQRWMLPDHLLGCFALWYFGKDRTNS